MVDIAIVRQENFSVSILKTLESKINLPKLLDGIMQSYDAQRGHENKTIEVIQKNAQHKTAYIAPNIRSETEIISQGQQRA